MAEDTKNRAQPTITRVAVIRLILYFLVLYPAYIGARISLSLIAERVPKEHAGAILFGATAGLCIPLIAVYVLLVRLVERRKVIELAPVRGIPLVLGGAVLGFALFCTVYAALWALGVAHWEGISGHGSVLPAVVMAMISAVGEELGCRGGAYRIFEDSLGSAMAFILSAGLFGLLHAFNHGATTVSTAAIALEAGVLYAAAYAVSRNLWLPIGLHFAWNFTEGGVFGAAVSGGKANGILNVPLTGPDILTGRAFGPEASLVAVAVCSVAAIVLIFLAIRNGRWVRLSFRMMLS
jgi:membrane protease YdiL (CAAX protease family)